MLDDFSASTVTDARRFGVSLAASLALYGSVATGVVLASAVVREVVVEEELLSVTFAPPPAPEPPPPPPPPPPAAAEPPPPAPAARLGQRRPELEAPTEIPDEAPAESDAPLAPPDDPFAPENEGDPNGTADGVLGGVPGGTGAEPAPAVAPPPPAPEPVRPTGPMRVPEGGTSPQPLDTSVQPEIPEDLRAAGLATVRIVVRVVVDEDGAVRECTVLRGHPLMPDANVVQAVRQWRFSPGRTAEGQTFVAIHTLPITFRISL